MSLAEDLATTARVLCKVAITRSSTQLRCDELDYALAAKRGLVQLLSLVHDTALRQPWNRVPTARPTHDLLTRDPVAALGQALRVCPTPDSPLAPSDLPLRDHHTPAGHAWSTIGRTVLSAHRQWDTGTTTLSDDQAWSAVADVAAVAAVLDTIDPDLARAAKHHKRPHVAAELSSRGHHLDTAARATLALAATGPLPTWDTVPTPPAPLLQVLPVTGPQDLRAGQQQVNVLLDAAHVLTPHALTQVLVAQYRAAAIATDLLTRHGTNPVHTDTAALGTRLTQLLDLAAAGRPGTVPLHGPRTDPRPAQQAGEVLRALTNTHHRAHTSGRLHQRDLDALTHYLRAAPTVVAAMSQATHRQLANHRWGVPNTRSEGPAWVPPAPRHMGGRPPQLQQRLEAASAALTAAVGRTTTSARLPPAAAPHPPAATAPRHALANPTPAHIDWATLNTTRPRHPGITPDRSPGRN